MKKIEIAIPQNLNLNTITIPNEVQWLLSRANLREKLDNVQYRSLGMLGIAMIAQSVDWEQYLRTLHIVYPHQGVQALRDALKRDVTNFSLDARVGLTHLGTTVGFGLPQYLIAAFQGIDQARLSTTLNQFYRESHTARVDMYPREIVKMLGSDVSLWKTNLENLLAKFPASTLQKQNDIDPQIFRKLCEKLEVKIPKEKIRPTDLIMQEIAQHVKQGNVEQIIILLLRHTNIIVHQSSQLCQVTGLVKMSEWFSDYLNKAPNQMKYQELMNYLQSVGVRIVAIELANRGSKMITQRYYFAFGEDLHSLSEEQKVHLLRYTGK